MEIKFFKFGVVKGFCCFYLKRSMKDLLHIVNQQCRSSKTLFLSGNEYSSSATHTQTHPLSLDRQQTPTQTESRRPPPSPLLIQSYISSSPISPHHCQHTHTSRSALRCSVCAVSRAVCQSCLSFLFLSSLSLSCRSCGGWWDSLTLETFFLSVVVLLLELPVSVN